MRSSGGLIEMSWSRVSAHVSRRNLRAAHRSFGTASSEMAWRTAGTHVSRRNLRAAHRSFGTPRTASSATATAPTHAAFCIIGDEILSGRTADTNTACLAKKLFAWGIPLIRSVVVPDDVGDIAATVRDLKSRVGEGGIVFTSGGIGPTHDDKTYEAVAAAFGLELELHQPTVDAMVRHYAGKGNGQTMNEARLRMARLPAGSDVLNTPQMWVPLAVCEGVHILPGIPWMFDKMLEAQGARFAAVGAGAGALAPPCRRAVRTLLMEGDIAEALAGVQGRFADVSVGSYPRTQPLEDGVAPYGVEVSLSGRDEARVEAAAREVEHALGALLEAGECSTSIGEGWRGTSPPGSA